MKILKWLFKPEPFIITEIQLVRKDRWALVRRFRHYTEYLNLKSEYGVQWLPGIGSMMEDYCTAKTKGELLFRVEEIKKLQKEIDNSKEKYYGI